MRSHLTSLRCVCRWHRQVDQLPSSLSPIRVCRYLLVIFSLTLFLFFCLFFFLSIFNSIFFFQYLASLCWRHRLESWTMRRPRPSTLEERFLGSFIEHSCLLESSSKNYTRDTSGRATLPANHGGHLLWLRPLQIHLCVLVWSFFSWYDLVSSLVAGWAPVFAHKTSTQPRRACFCAFSSKVKS